MINWIALALLALTMLVGALVLLRWVGRRSPGSPFPVGLVTLHIAIIWLGVGFWIAFMATDEVRWAWVSFVVILIGNGVGDLVLAGRWRIETALSGSWLRGWAGAALDLTKPKRRLNAAHALLAGITTIFLGLITLLATI